MPISTQVLIGAASLQVQGDLDVNMDKNKFKILSVK